MAEVGREPVPISAAAAHASRVHLGVCVPLLAIGLAIYCVRMYMRIRPVWKVSAEDYCITIGVVSYPFLRPCPQRRPPPNK